MGLVTRTLGHSRERRLVRSFEMSTSDSLPLLAPTETRETKQTRTHESLWKTKEFLVYCLIVLAAVVKVFTEAYSISTVDNPNYDLYSSRLQDGWLFGRKVDNSDVQFAKFRDNYPILFGAMALYLILSHLVKYLVEPTNPKKRPPGPLHRAFFFLAFSFAFLTVLHGASVLKILSIAAGNYAIARSFRGSKWTPALTWVYGLVVLFANETYLGYKYATIHERLSFLDQYNGIARWHVFFNITMLRMVSYNMDYYWMHQKSEDDNEDDDRKHQPLDDKDRIKQSRMEDDYCFAYYLSYLIYTPLYLAGPIITYNDFMSQLRYPTETVTIRSTILYGLRVLFSILLMEFMLHFFYAVAISKSAAWNGYTPFQMSVVGYMNLKFIWMKLMIMWRFFRFWAMADGIQAPENMIRCMSNNYSAQGFWRSWHRSFNRWLIRYIYIPLGGSKTAKYNIWVVFTFVALWHDLSLNLLTWGWLICLFMLPEILATVYFGRPKFQNWAYYRYLAGVGGVLNIFSMMAVNQVGFALGVDGTRIMISKILNVDGILFIVTASVALFSAVQVMFEIRESEKRANIHLNC